MVAGTQWVIFVLLLFPNLSEKPTLAQFFLFVLVTMIIGGSGYIINDIYDYKIDAINKPSKCYIPNPIDLRSAKIYYWTLILIGFCIACYLAIACDRIPFLIQYPLAAGLLYLYAKKLKSSILWGNIIVSIFVSYVSFVLYVWLGGFISNAHVSYFFIIYGIFSFLINMAREIIKDIEDINGDKSLGINTFPIRFGEKSGWQLAGVLTYLCGATSLFYLFMVSHDFVSKIFISTMILCPTILLGSVMVGYPKWKIDPSMASNLLKFLMLLGLLSITILNL
jgi:4-hydroxybenzoate polyprenyltransferase